MMLFVQETNVGSEEPLRYKISRRVKFFAVVSLVGLVCVMGAILYLFRTTSMQEMEAHHGLHNEILAQMFYNSLGHHGIDQMLNPPSNWSADKLRQSPMVEGFDHLIHEHIVGLRVEKVKLYNPQGLAVYSSDKDEIGESAASSMGFQSALAGISSGHLFKSGETNEGHDEAVIRDYYEIYVPIEDHGEVVGVFELYSDVTHAMEESHRTALKVLAGVGVILGGFYLIMLFLFYRVDQSLQEQELERVKYLNKLENLNGELESRVTERTEKLSALMCSLKEVMDAVMDAIFTLDDAGCIKSFNRAAHNLYKDDDIELYGRPLLSLLTDQIDVAPAVQDMDELVSKDYFETYALRPDGTTFPIELWIGRLSGGDSGTYIAVFHDISVRKKAEQELDQARQQYFHQEKMAAIGQLAAGILHEVNNPIAAITGAIEAIHESHELDPCFTKSCGVYEDNNRFLHLIESHASRLATITRDIADFADPRPGEWELLDLNSLLRSTLKLMSFDRRFKNIKLNEDFDKTLPAIMGVSDQLTQVFMNLLINASDAVRAVRERPSKLYMKSYLEEGWVRVLIEDNGCGMNEEIQKKATEIFFTTKPVGSGSGLGLSLCRTIIEEKHEGRLLFESIPDIGTKIYVCFPCPECDC